MLDARSTNVQFTRLSMTAMITMLVRSGHGGPVLSSVAFAWHNGELVERQCQWFSERFRRWCFRCSASKREWTRVDAWASLSNPHAPVGGHVCRLFGRVQWPTATCQDAGKQCEHTLHLQASTLHHCVRTPCSHCLSAFYLFALFFDCFLLLCNSFRTFYLSFVLQCFGCLFGEAGFSLFRRWFSYLGTFLRFYKRGWKCRVVFLFGRLMRIFLEPIWLESRFLYSNNWSGNWEIGKMLKVQLFDFENWYNNYSVVICNLIWSTFIIKPYLWCIWH